MKPAPRVTMDDCLTIAVVFALAGWSVALFLLGYLIGP